MDAAKTRIHLSTDFKDFAAGPLKDAFDLAPAGAGKTTHLIARARAFAGKEIDVGRLVTKARKLFDTPRACLRLRNRRDLRFRLRPSRPWSAR